MQPRDLSTHSVYRAGRGIEEVAREIGLDPDELVKLSSNENPLGPSPAAAEAIQQHATHSHTYPKAAHTDLTDAIARQWDVSPSQVWLANGGDGALDYLARAFLEPGDGVLVPDPGFAYYSMSARYHHGTVGTYQLNKADGFEQTATTVLESYNGERVVYITSPHNPTGRELPREELLTLADRTDDSTLILVDEAYAEFASTDSAIDLLGERDDIAVLRTFSKAYGLAGVRLGYLLAPPTWADAYERVTTPFAASELACRAGLAALEDDAHLDNTVELVRWAREYMHEQLQAHTWPSGGNFVLAAVDDAETVARDCRERGVIVRDCTSFGLSDCIRISCGTREETKRAVDVINDIV
ncbi:histidinol-phosphate transaminase [Halocatena pleomorpha]|uniref:Histidinol-phosphate aminotransferase n=1 Tax=Halocatena pleomorpha TaxID=1785090 RepID=A0A3P3RJI5_9EURY|nr:histidinol-phosphate transaminase [Halocatena pleomorpha]RRJ33535.1 histidinol-phosphate transaminase [Halocatena pleomorpha]